MDPSPFRDDTALTHPLKPASKTAICGMAEAMPFQSPIYEIASSNRHAGVKRCLTNIRGAGISF
jgi:hypothetical protein